MPLTKHTFEQAKKGEQPVTRRRGDDVGLV
jgi:hypothetical protein